MSTLKKHYRRSSFLDDAISAFDLFGTTFPSKDEFDEFITACLSPFPLAALWIRVLSNDK